MKNRDQKMRERYERLEEDRLMRMNDKKIRNEKNAFYAKTDKDREADEAYQRLLGIKAKMEG